MWHVPGGTTEDTCDHTACLGREVQKLLRTKLESKKCPNVDKITEEVTGERFAESTTPARLAGRAAAAQANTK